MRIDRSGGLRDGGFAQDRAAGEGGADRAKKSASAGAIFGRLFGGGVLRRFSLVELLLFS